MRKPKSKRIKTETVTHKWKQQKSFYVRQSFFIKNKITFLSVLARGTIVQLWSKKNAFYIEMKLPFFTVDSSGIAFSEKNCVFGQIPKTQLSS